MLDALTVARAGRPVLTQVALEVRFGAVVCVEGANGSGKTSLLRVLAGLTAPAAGTVRRAVSPCAFVPERVRLAPRVSPLAWLRAMDALRGARRSWPDDAAPWDLARATLERPAADLSKGTLQRVVLCESLTAPVSLLVLDEPWAGLDGEGRDLLARTLRARADAGCAVVLTDHSRMRHGRLEADAVWQLADGRATRATAKAPEMLVVATRDGRRAEHLVARGAHDALLAELLREGWTIDTVRGR